MDNDHRTVDDIYIFSIVELLSEGGRLTTHDGKTVTDLFPEFRPGQVLRFSRLFGPAKASSMPQQWRNAKKRKKKKKKQEDEKPVIEPPKSPPSPRPEDCMSDDEVRKYFGILCYFGQSLQKSRFCFSFVLCMVLKSKAHSDAMILVLKSEMHQGLCVALALGVNET